MAEHPGDQISVLFGSVFLRDALPVPFVFRIFTPWTVWALPFSTNTGFKLMNVASVAGSTAILYLYTGDVASTAPAALRAVGYFVHGGTSWRS